MNRKVLYLCLPLLLVVVALFASNITVNAQPGNWIIAAQPTSNCITSGLCRAGHADVTFPSGQGGASILQMNATGGFTGTISLSTVVSPLTGLIASCSPNSGILIGGLNGNATSNCSYTSTTPGVYSVTITGTNGTLSGQHSVVVPVTVIAFSQGLTPASVTFNSATTAQATLTLVDSGFNETVALSATTNPATGLLVTFSPTSLKLNTKTATTNSSTVTFSSSVPNVYNVTISGTGPVGPVVKINAIVRVQGYTLSASPNAFVRRSWGASLTSTVSVHALTGFTGNVNLFILPFTGFTGTFTPSTVTLTAGGTSTSSLVLTLGTPSPANVTIIVSGNATVTGGVFQMQVTTNVAVQVIGEVCLADPGTISANLGACPSTPFVFNGPFPSTPQTGTTQIRVGVFAQGSDALNGASVLLYTNRTELKPWNNLAGLDLTGSIIPSPSVFLYCVNDVIVSGPVCSNPGIPPPGLNTVEAIVTTTGSALTPPNATGLLFTLVFNVTANTIPLGHPIIFATGCGSTSAPGGVCVTVSAGATGKDPENFQAGNFTAPTPITVPWVAISSSVPSITIAKSGVATATIAATAENGYASGFFSYADLISFSATLTPSSFAAPTFSPTSCSTASVSCTTTMTASTAAAGTYFLTVRGTYQTQDPATGNFITLVGTTTIVVNVQDYTFTYTPNAPSIINFATGGSAVGTGVTISQGGISGAMTVSAVCNIAATLTINGVACGTVSATVASFTLTAGGTVTTSFTFTSAATAGHKVLYILTPHLGAVAHATTTETALINDFTFAATSPVSFTTGGTGSDSITIGSLGGTGTLPTCTTTCGFTGTVTFSAVSTPATGITVTCASVSVATPGSTVVGSCSFISATPGTYSVVITASGGSPAGSITHTATVSVTVSGDYSLSASPNPVSISTIGGRGNSTITVTAVNGLTGSVTLSGQSNSTALTCLLVPTSVAIGGTSNLSCTASAAGGFRVLITAQFLGADGLTLTHALNVTYTVSAAQPDFSISAGAVSPTSILATNTGTSTITITPSNGFTGTVTFTVSTSTPAGLTCNTPTQVTGGSGTTALNCSAAVGGDYTVTVTGSSTTPVLSHTTGAILFHVVDFSLSAPAITTLATVAGTSTVTVTPINSFTGTVTFSAGTVPAGCTASFSGAVLSVTCSTGIAPFSVVVTGTTGTAPNTLSRTTNVSVTVQDFSLSAPAITTLATVTGTSTVTVTPINGFAGTVTFTAGTVPAGCTATFSGAVLSVSCTTGVAPFSVVVTGTTGTAPNTLSRTTNVSVTIQDFSLSAPAITTLATVAGTSTVTVTPINGFAGTVTFSAGTVPAGCTATFSGAVLSVSCTTGVAPFSVVVTGTTGTAPNTLSRTTNVSVTIQDFSLSAPAITTLATVSGTSTVTVTPINGFAGTVTFSAGTVPAGCTASFSGAVLSVSCTTGVAPFTVVVTGTTGTAPNTLSRTTNVSVTIQDFSLSAPAITTLATVAGTSTVTVTPINGFAGTVTFSAGTVPAGCTASFSGAVLSVSCTTGVAPFSVVVTGTTGTAPNTLSRTTNVSVTVQDFSLPAPAITTLATVAGTSTVTVTPINGFAGTVTFTAGTVPAGCTASFSGAVLSVSCTTGVAPFSVVVTGTTGTAPNTLSRTTNVSVTIQDFSLSAPAITTLATVTGTSTVTVTPINGFAGTVTFSAGTVPAGCTASFSGAVLSVSCTTGVAPFIVVVTGTTGTAPNTLSRTTNVSVTIQDFSLSAPAITTLATVAGTSTVTVTPINGFAGTVTFSAGTVPAGCTATFSGAVLTVTCATGVAPFSVVVTGTTGTAPNTLSRTTNVSVTIQDFSLSAPAITTLATVAGTSTVTVTPINGFAGTVTFSAGTVPAGCTATFSGAVLSVSCTTGVAPFSVVVTGTTGTAPNTLSRTTNVSVTIQDFSLSAPAITTLATVAGTSTVTVTPINGFAGTVTFAAGTVPSGCTATFSGAVLTVTCATGVAPFSVVVTGTTGTAPNTLSRTTNVSVTIQDFSLSAPAITTLATVAGTSTVTVTPINGFAGTVTFSAGTVPAGCTASFSGAVLSVSCTTGVAPFSVVVTGTTGTAPNTLSRTTNVSVTIQDFSLSAPAITALATHAGTSTVTVTPINGFAGTVTFAAGSVPAGCTASFSGAVLSVTCATGVAPFSVVVTGTTGTAPNTLSRTTNVSVTVQDFSLSAPAITTLATVTGTSTVTVTPINGFAGTVTFTAGTVPAGCTASFSGAVLSVSCTTGVAPFSVVVTGTTGTAPNTLSRTTNVSVTVQDFSLSAPAITTLATVAGTSTVTVTPINGFAGTVTFTAGTVPAGCTASFSGAVLSVSCTTGVAPFSVVVTGTTGTAPNTLSRTTNVSVTIQDFSLSAPAITTLATVAGTSTVTVTPINGFAGTVTFTAGTVPAGCTATFSGAVLTVTCATGVAPFTVVVTGTTGTAPNTLSRTTNVSVTIQDFSLSAPAITALATHAATSTVTVTPINGFAGTVTFAAGTVPAGCTASFSGAVLSVTCATGVAPFSVTVTGTTGTAPNTLSRTTSVSVTVQDFSLSAPAITTLATVAGTSTVTVTPINGFAGTVTFAAGTVPAGCTATFSGAVLTVTCATGVAPFSVVVTGTTGTAPNTLSRTTNVSVTIQDFSLSAPAITTLATVAGTSTVTVTPINGFTGTVTFSAGTVPAGCTASFSGAVLSVSCTTGVAPFSVVVTGTTGTAPNTLSRTTSVSVTIQDFSLSAPAITTLATVTGTSTVTVTPINGFAGTVTFSAGTVPAGCTATFSGAVLSVSCTTGVAPFSVLVTGTTGTAPNTLSRTTNVSVTIQDFSLSAPAITTLATVAGTSTVTVTPINGFAGTVTFTAGTVPAGCTATFSGAVLSVSCTTGVAPFSVVVTGTTGTAPNTLSRTTNVSVTVQDFSLSAPAITTLATVAGTSTVTVTPINGFAGTVTFSAGTVPAGCTATFSGAVLSVNCTTGVAPFSVTVTGTTGTAPNTLSRTTSVSVTVQDFSLSAPAITTLATVAGTSTVTVTPINGFAGTVTFTAGTVPAGCTATFSGAVLTVTCATGVAPFSVVATGTTGTAPNTLSRTTNVSVTIQDFSLSAPAITALATHAGTSTVTVTPINGFAGTVTFSAGAVPSGCTATFSGAVLSVTCATGVAPFSVTVTGTTGTAPNTLSRTTSVSVTVQDFSLSASPSTIVITTAGTAGTSAISVTNINGFTGTVTLSVTSTQPAGCTATLSGSTLSVSCTPLPTTGFTVVVTGTTGVAPNTLSRTVNVPVAVSGFTLSASPTSITTLATVAGTSTITVTPIGTFSGTVTLAASGAPAGCTATVTSPVTLPPAAIATLTVTCSTGVAPFTVTVTGTSSPVVATVNVPVTIQDFSLSAPAITTLATVAGTSTVTVTPINGFAGTVTFSAGTVPAGCTATFSGAVLSVNCTTGVAAFSVVVTGTTGTAPNTLSRTTNVSVTIQDFSLSAPAITTLATVTGTSTVTVTPINGFAGTVTFTAGTVPAGCTATFSGAVLSVSCTTGVAPFSVVVTGTTGTAPNTLSRTTNVSVTIQDFSLSAPAITTLATVAGTSTVTVTPINGFAGTVTFTAGTVPTGCTASFSGAVLSVSCTTGVTPFSVVVTGTTGTAPNTLSRTTNVSVTVQDFSLSAPAITTLATVAGTSTVTVTPINGFAGTVTFSAGTVPAGCTASFTGAVLSVSCTTGVAPFSVVVTGTTGTAPNTLSRTTNVSVTVQDFSLSAPAITTLATVAGTSTVTVTPINGFAGTVTFTAGTVPSGCTATFSGAVLTVTCATGVAPFSVVVTGTTGTAPNTLSRTTNVSVTIQDFSLSAPAITTLATVTGTSTVTVTPINGFAGTVTFTAGTVPAGCTASFSGAVLSVSCTTGVAPFSVTVTGTTGTAPNTLSRTTNVSVTIQDFSLSAPAITTLATVTGTSTVTVTPINGFAGTVTFTAGTVPAGCTASFSGAVLSVSCTTGVAPFSVVVTGTTGTAPNTLSRTTNVSVTIQDFSLSAPAITTLATVAGTSTVTVTPINGFAGTVTFSAGTVPAGCTATFSGAVLSVRCTTGVAPFSVTVTGTTGTAPNTLSRTTSVSVTVQDFSLSAPAITTLATVAGTSTVTVTPINGFAGTVTFTAGTVPAGCTASFSGAVLSVTCSTGVAPFTVTVTGTTGTAPNTLSRTTSVSVTVQDFTLTASPATISLTTAGVAGSSTISVTGINGFAGTVTFSAGTVPAGCTASFSGAVLSVSCSPLPTSGFTVVVTGTTGTAPNTLSRTVNVPVTVPGADFTISASAVTPATILATNSGSSTITITGTGGFTGTVTFTVSASTPAGLTCNTPTQVTGGSGATTLTCSAAIGGDYTVTVTGSSTAPVLSHTTGSILFHVVDFSLSAPAITTLATVAGTSTVTVTPINSFTGTVTFTAGTVPAGCTATFSGAVLTVTCATGVAPFSVTVTGTTGTAPATLSRTTSVSVTVQDFSLSAPAITTLATITGTSTVTVTPINGFAGTVTFSAGTVPAGCTASFSGAVLSVSCSTGVAPFSVIVTGTTGTAPNTLSRTTSVSVTVQDFSLSAPAITTLATVAGTSTVTVTPINGFAGTVTFTAGTVPAGCTASFSGAILSVSCTTGVAPFSVVVTGTTGTAPNTLSRTTNVSVTIQDFSLSAPAITTLATVAGTSTVTVTPINGFAGTVTFSAGTVPAGCTATFSGAVLSVSCTTGVAPFSVVVTGTTGTAPNTLSRTTSVSVTVQDFTVSAPAITTLATVTGVSTVAVAPINGFTGIVTFSAGTVPAGCTASFSGAVLSVSCATGVAPFSVIVSGVTGTAPNTLTRLTSVSVTVQDFSLTATPASINTTVNTPGTSTISVTPINGFASAVTFSAGTVPAGCTASFSGAVLSVNCNASNSFTVIVTGTTGTAPNTLSRTVNVPVSVGNVASFTLTATSPAAVPAGTSVTSTITVTGQNGFPGTVTLSDSVPSGLTCGSLSQTSFTASGTATLTCTSTSATAAGIFQVTITGTSTNPVSTQTATATFSFTAVSTIPGCTTCSVTSSATITNPTFTAANINFTASGATGTMAFANVTISKTNVDITNVQVFLNGTLTPFTFTSNATAYFVFFQFTFHSVFNVSIHLGHTFSIDATSPAKTDVGQQAVSTITVTGDNGFTGVVTLTDTIPSGLTCGAITPGTVTGSGTATVSCTSTAAADYTLAITGTSGSIVKTATVHFSFADFTLVITAAPTVNVNQFTTALINVVPLNGFAGSVSLSEIVPAGLTCNTVTPANVIGSGTFMLTCTSATAANYMVPVTGSDGIIQRTGSVPFSFTDFTITASTTSITQLNAGATAMVTITIAPLNGFTGTVTLTTTASLGLSVNLSTMTVTGGSGMATLSVSAQVAGNYMVTVKGTNLALSHSTPTINVQVVDFQVLAATSTLTTTPGVPVSTTIIVTAVNGFTGTVALTNSTTPSGLGCSLAPATVTGGAGNSTLTCVGVGGSYTVVVKGTNGALSHTANVTVNVVDFTLTACTPQPVPVVAGGPGSCTITVAPVGGFTGTVTLSFTNNGTISSTPSPTSITSATLSPTTITISGTATLTITTTTTTNALFVFNVTGTSPGLSHSIPVSFSVKPSGPCPGCAPPDLTQFQWTHRLSIAKTGGTQTWKFGVSNGPGGSNNVTIFVNVRISITDGSAGSFTLNSGVLTLGPGKNLVGQLLSTTFPSGDVNTTFNWSVSIQWGTSPTALTNFTFTDTTGVPSSGSFTVLP